MTRGPARSSKRKSGFGAAFSRTKLSGRITMKNDNKQGKKSAFNNPPGNRGYRPAGAIALNPQMLRIWPGWGRQFAQGSAGAEGLCG
jgi:hypothetical protein